MENLKVIYTNSLSPASPDSFQIVQLDRYEGAIGILSGTVYVFIKGAPINAEAAVKHVGDFPMLMSDGYLFQVPFNTDQTQTASDLCDAINNENLNVSSPLFGLISASPIGVMTAELGIEANLPGLKFDITNIHGVSLQRVCEPYEMDTDDRYVELELDVRSGSISLLQTGDEVNASNGHKIDSDEFPYFIKGREDIMRAQVVEITPGATLNYTVYIKE